MRWQRFMISLNMHFRMLMRRQIVLLLLSIIPCLFILMVQITSSKNKVFFQIGVAASKTMVTAPEVNVALIFITLATTGFLASFLSLNLVQQYQEVNRRLVICGYHPGELILSGLIVMIAMILLLVTCIGSAILFFFQPENVVYMMLGLLFTGLIYGSYGILVGSLVKGELEGTLLVILLANIDAGWLQNPLFFSEARNKFIIQLLPAYYSSQISIAATFTHSSFEKPILRSIIYTTIFLGVALAISYYRMRIKKHVKILA
jgi:ABC-2 type transport system permease protein